VVRREDGLLLPEGVHRGASLRESSESGQFGVVLRAVLERLLAAEMEKLMRESLLIRAPPTIQFTHGASNAFAHTLANPIAH